MQSKGKFVTILDIGLRTKAEHSFAIVRRLRAELLARDIGIEIYGNVKVEPAIMTELSVIPHFQRGMYDDARSLIKGRIYHLLRRLKFTTARAPPSEAITVQRYNDQFLEDLAALPLNVFETNRICLFPGLFQNQLLGLARFVVKNHQKIESKIVCVLMFPPNWTAWGEVARIGPKVYAEAFNLMRPFIGSKIFFASENLAIASLFQNQFSIEVALLPIPLGESEATTTNKERHIRIGFMGNSKREKGFHLLPEAMRICCETRTDLTFLIQVNPEPSNSLISATIAKIRAAPCLRVLDGPLTSEAYQTESQKLDVVLLPYDPKQFGMRGSGVFTEAVTSGKLIVATQGTWAAQEIRNQTAVGEIFENYDSQSLAYAVLRLCDRFEVARQLALSLASKSKGKNSPAAYVDRLLSLTG